MKSFQSTRLIIYLQVIMDLLGAKDGHGANDRLRRGGLIEMKPL